ncbi:hypothetical protein JSO53_04140 [Riemerella anatipestifer]|uniref:hypothetical protein n=1 Tax=Riemerella anatipestifer TaxID=34085 RepID=UPI0002AB6678|nr:hypothetical protein [Riemerella anatipestifer]AGC39502.1 hypothetical protein G148_0197 [Riemerella anatipestifer RA-CH-2]AKP71659.1 hypothetical protein CG09_1502 [Riemerella anatipestifer]MBT0561971.1 hypothetical protein [Riemerella anatipestifer]MCU7539554.1 hypothetical protein [Riemerella anatipestifer]MCU7574279.1 hypothetical protein [Riemerella anatipestifer]
MREYIALHKKSSRKIYFKYSFLGVLEELKMYGEKYTEEQVKWVLQSTRMPFTESQMLFLCSNKKLDFDYMPMPTDLSFEFFWNLYGYKKGKIATTQKAWNALSDADKIEVLLYIPKFKETKKIDKTAMPYPSTFLNQKYWLADKI